MKIDEYKMQLWELLNQEVENLTTDERMFLVEGVFFKYQVKHDWDVEHPNKEKRWDDSALRVILKSEPTKENCILYSRLFGRSAGSVELIYRWAETADMDIPERYAGNSFIKQVKRIAEEVGWR